MTDSFKTFFASETIRRILDAAPDAIVIVDDRGEMVFVNTQASAVFGYSRDEMLRKRVELLIPHRFRDRHPEHRISYTREPRVRPMGAGLELSGLRKDGTEFPVEISLSPLRTEHGAVVITAIRDITDRKRAAEAVRTSEARIRQVLETAHEAFIEMDDQGRITEWNPAAETLFGWRRSEVIGRSVAETVIPLRSRGRYERGLREFLATGESDIFGKRLELSAVRRDGSTLPVELTVSSIGDGTGYRFTAFVHDITERRKAKEELARLATIVESSDDAIFRKDLDGVILSWNAGAEKLYGYSAAEMIGRNLRVLVPADLMDEVAVMQERLQAGDGIAHHDTARVRKDGRRVDVSVTMSPIKDRSGAVVGTSTIARDITARKRTEEALARRTAELARSNAELEQFAYVASHDLQEPLRMVMSYVQLLREEYGDRFDAEAEEYFAFAFEGASRAQELISDLLEFSRFGRGGRPFQRVECESTLNVALENLSVAIRESGAVVTRSALPEIVGDPSELCRLFQNLLANAIKFRSHAAPTIHVESGRGTEEWLFCVRDDGIGIAPNQFDRIFRIFQRLHTRSKYPGTGVGLAICKKIVEHHGGRIWVESQPNKGSAFFFTVPFRPPIAAAVAATSQG